jgi:hypothetical protein
LKKTASLKDRFYSWPIGEAGRTSHSTGSAAGVFVRQASPSVFEKKEVWFLVFIKKKTHLRLVRACSFNTTGGGRAAQTPMGLAGS